MCASYGCECRVIPVGYQKLLLPSAAECIVELHERHALVQTRLCKTELGVKVASVAIQNLEIAANAATIPTVGKSCSILRRSCQQLLLSSEFLVL